MEIKINKRNLEESNFEIIENLQQKIDIKMKDYNQLKERLKVLTQKEILNKIETLKILKEIKDKNYYKIDGYANFDNFLKDFKLAKTQAYEYLKIANALEDGKIQEEYIIANGINKSINLLRSKTNVKKLKIKPLRFLLKNEEAYLFFKENGKFCGHLLDMFYKEKKDLLEGLLKEYNELEK